MKLNNIVLLASIVSFYYLINQFLDLGGLNHYLLKIIIRINYCSFYHDFIKI